MRRIQVTHRGAPRRDDPGRVLPIDPRDPDILRVKQTRRATDATRRSH